MELPMLPPTTTQESGDLMLLNDVVMTTQQIKCIARVPLVNMPRKLWCCSPECSLSPWIIRDSFVDFGESLAARDKLCPSSWQKAQKGGSWGYATILSVVSADFVGGWGNLFAQRTWPQTPQAQSSFRVRTCATCCDTLESQGSC